MTELTGSEVARRLDSLQLVARELAAARGPAEIADVIVDRATLALGGLSGSLCLLDGDTFELVREINYRREIEQRWHTFPLAASLPAGDAIRSGEPLVMASIADRDAQYPMFAGTPTESKSFVVLPLFAGEVAVGVFTIGFPDARDLDRDDLAFLQALAALCAQSLHRARLLDAAERIADVLQQSLLPTDLPSVPGLDVAARYVPYARGVDVSGDFYDLIRLGPDRAALVIGDVCGKGVGAARHTSLVRHALRSATLSQPTLAAALAKVNRVVGSYRDDAGLDVDASLCTVSLAVLEARGDGRVRATIASGGHPLPLLLRPGQAPQEVGEPGTLLGVFDVVDTPEVELELAEGDALLLYTDGVTDRRLAGRFFGEEGLLRAVEGEHATAAAVAEAVLAAASAYVTDGRDDDMAVVVAKATRT